MPRRGAFATWEAADWWLWWCGGSHGRSAPTFERCEDMKIPYFLYCVAWWSSLVNAPMLGYFVPLELLLLGRIIFHSLTFISSISSVWVWRLQRTLVFSIDAWNGATAWGQTSASPGSGLPWLHGQRVLVFVGTFGLLAKVGMGMHTFRIIQEEYPGQALVQVTSDHLV